MNRRDRDSITALSDFHKLGRLLFTADPDTIDVATGRRRRGGLERLIKQLGRNRNELTKARKFAQLFNTKEVKKLCRIQSADQKRLTKSHICRLVTVRSRRRRLSLSVKCAKQGWTVLELERQIAKCQAKRPYGGRKVRRPNSLEELLGQLDSEAKHWLTYVASLRAKETKKRSVRWTDVPPKLRRRLLRIILEMSGLTRSLGSIS